MIQLVIGDDPNGRGLLALAVRFDEGPYEANMTILTPEIVPDAEAAREWFARALVEQPWEERH